MIPVRQKIGVDITEGRATREIQHDNEPSWGRFAKRQKNRPSARHGIWRAAIRTRARAAQWRGPCPRFARHTCRVNSEREPFDKEVGIKILPSGGNRDRLMLPERQIFGSKPSSRNCSANAFAANPDPRPRPCPMGRACHTPADPIEKRGRQTARKTPPQHRAEQWA